MGEGTNPRRPYERTVGKRAVDHGSEPSEAGMIMAAVDALQGDQQTFTRAQVAHLLWLAFNSGHTLGIEDGYRKQNDALADGLRIAFGGADAPNMREAVRRHIRAADQKQRRDWDRLDANRPRPHGLRLNDPTWPRLNMPGTVADPKTLPGVWPCPCPRTRDGGHMDPPNGDPDYWMLHAERRQPASEAA
ncbi:hypothetical protein [Micromonospora sediminicola]|uniref:hypothetical protein n=1 Tax=Micromonospora sediminicola TaxID=946078 RepID=UPI003798B2BA